MKTSEVENLPNFYQNFFQKNSSEFLEYCLEENVLKLENAPEIIQLFVVASSPNHTVLRIKNNQIH